MIILKKLLFVILSLSSKKLLYIIGKIFVIFMKKIEKYI